MKSTQMQAKMTRPARALSNEDVHLTTGRIQPHRIAGLVRAKLKRTRTVLRYTITGTVIGLLMGWLFSLVSGNVFVILMVGSLVTVVGLILGFIHRNDP